MKKEKIICAAVRWNRKIWYGHRHTHALQAMKDELSYKMNREEMNKNHVGEEQGFVTSEGRYVGREEAMIIAGEAEQISNEKYNNETLLLSEDLY